MRRLPSPYLTPFAQRSVVNSFPRNPHEGTEFLLSLNNLAHTGGREKPVSKVSLHAASSCGNMASTGGTQAHLDLGKPQNMHDNVQAMVSPGLTLGITQPCYHSTPPAGLCSPRTEGLVLCYAFCQSLDKSTHRCPPTLGMHVPCCQSTVNVS